MSELLHNLIATLQKSQRAQERLEKIGRALWLLDAVYQATGVNSSEDINAARLEFIVAVRTILKGDDARET